METKFTNGPWHVWYTGSTFEHRIRASSKVGICATVEWASGSEEESLANAKLIAASPELYTSGWLIAQLIQMCLDDGDEEIRIVINRGMAEAFVAARAKARGES